MVAHIDPSVLETLAPTEAEVRTRDDRWLMMRMRPYRTVENVISGVVLTFADITELKRVEESLAAELSAMARLQQLSIKIVESTELEPPLISVLDATMELLRADFGNIQLYDSPILAMDMEDRLKSEGCDVIGRVSRQAKAFEVLEKDRPDALVLDLDLHGELPSDLVDALVARQIPFVIVTGYGNRHFDIAALQGAPRLHKPICTRELVRALSGLIGAAD